MASWEPVIPLGYLLPKSEPECDDRWWILALTCRSGNKWQSLVRPSGLIQEILWAGLRSGQDTACGAHSGKMMPPLCWEALPLILKAHYTYLSSQEHRVHKTLSSLG